MDNCKIDRIREIIAEDDTNTKAILEQLDERYLPSDIDNMKSYKAYDSSGKHIVLAIEKVEGHWKDVTLLREYEGVINRIISQYKLNKTTEEVAEEIFE